MKNGDDENNLTDKINTLQQQLRLNNGHFRAQMIGSARSEGDPL